MTADRLAPDHREWRLDIPRADTNVPLALNFPESLDHALLKRMIRILNEQHEPVLGKIKISDFETKLEFTPDAAWRVGDYQIAVNTALEDLAGNSLRSLFEHEVLNSDGKHQKQESLVIPFTIQLEVSEISSN